MSGPECCRNPPVIQTGEESGEVVQIASLNSYVSGKLDSIAVILVSDVFGYEAPKLRQLADKVASAGYYALVPDFFNGDPLTDISQIDDWLINHAPEQAVVEFARPVIQALKDKGVTKIGAAGFCWGAKVVVELTKDAEVQVAALLHPSFVDLDDIKGVKVPIAILSAELEKMNPPELIKEYEAALTANKVEHFVKIYPGVNHGWTTRYNDDDAAEVKSAEEAQQDLVDWFKKFL